MHNRKSALSGRLLCAACASYTFGIAVYALFAPSLTPVLIALFAFAICAIFKKLPYFFIIIIAAVSFAGGMSHFHIIENNKDSFAEKYSGRYVTISGRAVDVSSTKNDNQQIIVKADSISALGKTENKNFSLCIYTDRAKSFSVGDKLIFSDIFTPFRKSSSHGFDSETYFYTKNISASFSLPSEYISSSPGSLSFAEKIRLLSRTLSGEVRNFISGDTGEVAAAIMLGDKSGFTDHLNDIFTKSGISHIVAVSGMHLSILTGFFFFLAAKTRLHYKIRNIIGILLVLLYMTVTGFSPSVTRAGIMTIFVLAAAIFDRKDDVATSFFTSSAVILAANPYYICSASFLLSYTALAGILIFAGPLSRKLKFLPRFIRDTVATTLSATSMTLPVLAYMFNSISILSVITNILVVPLVSIIFISALISTVMSFIYAPIGSAFAIIPGLLIKFVLACARIVSAIPYSTINMKSPGAIWIICFSILAALLYFWLTGRKTGYAGKLALSFVICVSAISFSISAFTTSVTFFDIGQGDCALIKLPGFNHCLIDTGPNGNTALSALKSKGVNNIDIIFISHADNDHSGALADILKNFPTRKVVFPNYDILGDELAELADIAVASGADVEFADNFTGYSFAGMTAEVLWPSNNYNPADRNDGSLVLKLNIKNNSFLFTGDIGSLPEQKITRLADSDVLKVSHHGSGDSSSADFLKRVSPQYSVISAGKNNVYGHPAEETLERLENSGSKILRTDLLGDITFKIGLSGNMEVRYETD